MRKTFSILSSLALCMLAHTAMAQNGILTGKDNTYAQKEASSKVGNYNNGIYFVNSKGLSNLLGGVVFKESSTSKGMSKVSGLLGKVSSKASAKLFKQSKIGAVAVDPKGATYAVAKQGAKRIKFCDLWEANKVIGNGSTKAEVTAIGYSADGSKVFAADAGGNLNVFARNYKKSFKVEGVYQLPFIAQKMTVSPDGNIIAIASGNNVALINATTHATMATITTDANVNAMEFGSDSKDLGVVTTSGTLNIYSTVTYALRDQIEGLGEALDLGFHPGSKYVAVLTGSSQAAIINLSDPSDRTYVDIADGGATDVLFTSDAKGTTYMVYNSTSAIHCQEVNAEATTPYLGKMVNDKVDQMMANWEKRMPTETDQQFKMRVNDQTRAAQKRMFEDQVATKMAGDYASSNTLQFSKYNPRTKTMQLDFDKMNPIFLNVAQSDINSFTSAQDVELRNPVYSVGKGDKYELVYADVYNKKTGKTYTFDNREHKSLEHMTTGDGFMPLQYAQNDNTNSMKLDEIKNDVVSAAKKAKSISDHTNINVNTEMIQNGNAIDYKVGFGYSVDAAFSAKEDFGSGKYSYKQSKAAQAMLKIIKEALNTNFAQYIKEGKKVTVKITGSADASAIKKTLPYAGEYGDLVDCPVTKDNKETTVTVTKKGGITTNDQLAYLRATGMRVAMQNSVPALKKMNTTYKTYINQAEGVGGEYRRILVDFIFEDAFDK